MVKSSSTHFFANPLRRFLILSSPSELERLATNMIASLEGLQFCCSCSCLCLSILSLTLIVLVLSSLKESVDGLLISIPDKPTGKCLGKSNEFFEDPSSCWVFEEGVVDGSKATNEITGPGRLP